MRALPTNESRYDTYQNWKRWSAKEFAEYDQKTQYYFKKLFSRLISKKYLKILEIGFGNGSLAGWLKTFHPSVNWTGIEVQQTLIEKAQNAGFDALSNLDQVPAGKQFDVIVALDVIEHLSDGEIKEILERSGGLLANNGVLILRSPNAGGPFGLPNQVGDPTHITPISTSRLSSYATDWCITEKGDLLIWWNGKFLSFIRNCLRNVLRLAIEWLIRFAFSPQPKHLLSSNLHLFLTKL